MSAIFFIYNKINNLFIYFYLFILYIIYLFLFFEIIYQFHYI